MSICMPGAIELASHIRNSLEYSPMIVLGGRHCNETIFKNKFGEIQHLKSSPITLMSQGQIPAIFDFVISGEPNFLIKRISEVFSCLG